tara:strand:- start:641 stop:1099 length:459 start_codon:yes stop_codon:yes gene_type:complete
MRIFFLIFLILISFTIKADILIKPDPLIKPIEVISIQLKALQNNNVPFKNAGIEQTWEFAHPNNRAYTGPLKNFIKMINNPSYSMMLDHSDHEIIPVKEDKNISYFFVKLTDSKANIFGFEWTVSKVKDDSEFNNCWMTVGVSRPMPLANST